MSKRAHRNNSDAASLFPFLAVLLCTMGALIVLLVMLAQRAAKQSAAEMLAKNEVVEKMESPVSTPPTADLEEIAAIKQKLDETQKYQQQLNSRRTEAEQRLRQEQARLSHLEEHTRRLEHELARLSIAADQLKATENDQSVDQDAAKSELARLETLIEENEERLEELREQAKGKHSYAIVPYKGPHGTFRKPIYIECREDGVVIHPEGTHFPESDFIATSWPGNPLAAALRASREYLNAKAAKAGEPEPPDPYPLLLVRPDGIEAYSAARAAISSWDSDYGYEFIAGDWTLDFPDMPDPLLAQVQSHAALNARDRMAQLARSAPSRFRGMGVGGSGASAYGGTSGSNGYGSGGQQGASSKGGTLADSSGEGSPDGDSLTAGESAAHYDGNNATGTGSDGGEPADTQYGAMPGGLSGNESNGYQMANGSPQNNVAEGLAGDAGEGRYAAGQGTSDIVNGSQSNSGPASGKLAQGGDPNQSSAGSCANGSSSAEGSPNSTANASQAAGARTGATATGSQANSASMAFSNNSSSIADKQGINWAVKQSQRGAVPIRRPIDVVVRKDQIALLPSRHVLQGAGATGATISLNQPVDQISSEFVAALRTRVKEWGLAGNGLYWRPVLELKVGPGAQVTAHEITRLLKDSGVEVRLPEVAQAGQGATSYAPK